MTTPRDHIIITATLFAEAGRDAYMRDMVATCIANRQRRAIHAKSWADCCVVESADGFWFRWPDTEHGWGMVMDILSKITHEVLDWNAWQRCAVTASDMLQGHFVPMGCWVEYARGEPPARFAGRPTCRVGDVTFAGEVS